MSIWIQDKKIDYKKPVIMMDVNQVYLKDRSTLPPSMTELPKFEYGYFFKSQVELCVSPATEPEILKGKPLSEHVHKVYERVKKSQLFKNRPEGYIFADMNDRKASELWTAVRHTLFPSVSNSNLNANHIADIDHIFYHTTASGYLESAAFITMDDDILSKQGDLNREFGIRVMSANDAWREYQPKYNLYQPSCEELSELDREYSNYQAQIVTSSGVEYTPTEY